MPAFPELMHTALDSPDARELAEFYRRLLGLRYRPGDEPPTDGSADIGADWLVLLDDHGHRKLAFQKAENLVPPTWPSPAVPMQLHLDFNVVSLAELHRHRHRAQALGARVLLDRTHDAAEPLYVLADPAGHPFCLLVA